MKLFFAASLLFLLETTASSQGPASPGASLDYNYFRDRVQPVFLAKRPGHARCISCHESGNPRLQELSPGATTWDEEQSRKNFQAWQRVVVPGDPDASRLLMHPLAQEAGGDAFHAGGKHWASKGDPEWQVLAAWVRTAISQASSGSSGLDFQVYVQKVEPIFLKSRQPGEGSGNACFTCHTVIATRLRLQPISPGNISWTEEQSRKNLEVVSKLINPDDPEKSPLLLHPLATAAGGDSSHTGGKFWAAKDNPEWQTIASWARSAKRDTPTQPAAGAAVSLKQRVVQTNSAGDNVHVIDPVTNQVVGVIEDIEVPHGVAFAPDGSRIYITDEPRKTLDVIDAKSLESIKRIPLTGRPNNLDVTKDGAYVYVGIAQAPGAVNIIDTTTLTNIKTIPTTGIIHNVYVTPDGRYAVAGSISSGVIHVIDIASNIISWTIKETSGIRPMAFTTNVDGSTKEIIVQLSEFHGFAIIDFASHKEKNRITLPDIPGQQKVTDGLQASPSHGLAITKDGKLLWATSKWYDYVAAYSLPDFKLIKIVPVGLHPEWLTIPPDGKNLYVALAGNNATVAVDIREMKVVATIPVGFVPKRNASGLLQAR
jgi:YVTN family beta-propeller protein